MSPVFISDTCLNLEFYRLPRSPCDLTIQCLTPTILTLVCRVWASLDCSSRSWVSLWRKLSGDEMRYFTAEEMCLEGGVFLGELLFLFYAISDFVRHGMIMRCCPIDRPAIPIPPPHPPNPTAAPYDYEENIWRASVLVSIRSIPKSLY